MSARALLIGLDSINATLLERWADRGHLPHFAALRARATAFRLNAACMESLPGAIWSDICYGQPAGSHGLYFHPEQFNPTEGILRRVGEHELLAERLVWSEAAAAGLRCAVVDVPFMPLIRGLNGVQLREFAIHDIAYGYASEPQELANAIAQKHGLPPLHAETCDDGCGRENMDFVFQSLLTRADRKTNVLCDLMQRDRWDIFFAVYGETHCASHYLWPRRTLKGDWYSEVTGASDCWEPLRQVCARVDAGIGRLLAEAGPDTKVLLFCSHGVGTYLGGPQLLNEVLRRMDLSDGWDWPGRRYLRKAASIVRQEIPVRFAEDMPLGRTRAMADVRTFLGMSRFPDASGKSRAFAIPNNRIGAIRLNIKGRDRFATMPPDEAPALLDKITSELERLQDPRSGERIVKHVARPPDLYGKDACSNLPDLLVKFRTDLGPIERCWSAAVGHIHVSNARPRYRRSGDHVAQSRAWVSGPGYPSAIRGRGDVLDIAPTILSLAGVGPAPHMTGMTLASRLPTPA